jgi:serralysin
LLIGVIPMAARFSTAFTGRNGIAQLLETGVATGPKPFNALPMASAYADLFIFGTSASETLNATQLKPFVAGMDGDDTINGDGGNNILVGDYFEASYLDYAFDGVGDLSGYPTNVSGNDVIYGGGGNDAIFADFGDDRIYGGNGDDEIDCIVPSVGNSEYFGGSGHDVLQFLDPFDLGFSKVAASTLILDDAHGIELVNFYMVKLQGTSADDLFDFSGTDLVFENADDRIFPSIDMGAGNDRFIGNSSDIYSDYWVVGGSGKDSLNGGGGQDILDGGKGIDLMKGGLGADIYLVDNRGDIVKEAKVTNLGGVETGGDTIQTTLSSLTLVNNVENLTYLGPKNFAGTGNSGSNHILGGDSKDVLVGLGGSDTLEGGLGKDVLTGGSSADVFVFSAALGGTNIDAITDFNVTQDTIWLTKSGAGMFNTLTKGDLSVNGFKVIGDGDLDGNDRILYDSATGKIFYDADGSGGVEKVLFATVAAGTVLTEADFFVI